MKRTSFRAAAAILLAGALTVPALAAPLLPHEMQPDSILTYDEDLNPIVLQGGYLSEEAYEIRPPERTVLPPSATEDEIRITRLTDQAAAIRYFDLMAGYVPESLMFSTRCSISNGTIAELSYRPGGVHPGMLVEYGHDGWLQKILFPDPADPSGYSSHNLPPDFDASTLTFSAALPIVQQMRAIVDWFHQK